MTEHPRDYQLHQSKQYDRCPKCGTATLDCPGIGPYCPNQNCDLVDNLNGSDPHSIYSLPRAERRPELPEPLIVPDWTLVGIYAIAGLIVGIAGTMIYLRFG